MNELKVLGGNVTPENAPRNVEELMKFGSFLLNALALQLGVLKLKEGLNPDPTKPVALNLVVDRNSFEAWNNGPDTGMTQDSLARWKCEEVLRALQEYDKKKAGPVATPTPATETIAEAPVKKRGRPAKEEPKAEAETIAVAPAAHTNQAAQGVGSAELGRLVAEIGKLQQQNTDLSSELAELKEYVGEVVAKFSDVEAVCKATMFVVASLYEMQTSQPVEDSIQDAFRSIHRVSIPK